MKQVIDLDSKTFVAVLGDTRDKATKIIISDEPDDLFVDSRIKYRTKQILFEDNEFK